MPTPTADRPERTLVAKGRHTYDDYQQLPEGAPYELINGHLVMSPSPSFQHQELVLALGAALREYVQSREEGNVSIAPMDVRLSPDTVVQPDVLYLSPERTDRIEEQKIDGAPDLIIEIASPSTGHLDAFDKKQLYETHGVQEYWIVDPDTESVEVYVPTNGEYPLHQRRVNTGTVTSLLLDDFAVELSSLFQ